MEPAQQLFAGVVDRFEALTKHYRLLKNTRLTGEMFRKLVTGVVALDPRLDPKFNPEAKLADLMVERAERKASKVFRLWGSGKGHTGDRSAWEPYNAAAEILDHNRELFPTRSGAYRTAPILPGRLPR